MTRTENRGYLMRAYRVLGILAIAAAMVVAAMGPPAQAAVITYTWTPTATGTYDWNNAANWGGVAFPNNGGGNTYRANLSNDILIGDQTVQLNIPITLYRMDIGDSGANPDNSFNVVATGGSFVFDNGATAFTLTGIGQAAGNSIAANIQLNSHLTVDLPTNIDRKLTISGDITTSTGKTLTKTGVGTLVLTGSGNSFASTTMSGGTLAVNSDAALGAVPSPAGTNITLSGGSTLRFDAPMTLNANRWISLAGDTTLDLQGYDVIIDGKITGANTFVLTKTGTGRLDLTSTASTADMAISKGVVRPASSALTTGHFSLADTTGGSASTAVLETSGNFQRNLAASSAGTISWDGSGGFAARGGSLLVDLTITGGKAPGTGARDTYNWGHITGFMNGHSEYVLVFGSTTADNVVEWYDNINLSSTDYTSTPRQIKVIDNPGETADYAKITGGLQCLSDIVPFEKIGNGLLELDGANIYAGPTTVSEGTLLVNGTLDNRPKAVTVASGATLGGTGTISRPVTISTGGHVAPGASIGTLTLSQGVALHGQMDAEISWNPTTTSDVLALTGGNLVLDSSTSILNVIGNLAGSPAFTEYTIATVTGGGSVSGTFNALKNNGNPGLPTGWSVQYNTNSIKVIPEPATMTLLGLGGLVLGWSRMRSRKRRAA